MTEPPRQDVEELIGLFRSGRLADSERKAKELAARFPDALLAHRVLGTAQIGQRKFAEAESTLRGALKIAPDLAEIHDNLGAAYYGQGKLEAAVMSFRAAIKTKPDFAAAYNTLGGVLRELGRSAEAVESYWQAAKLMPGAGAVHRNLAAALHDLGRLDEAAASAREALKIDANDTVAHNNLANVLWSQRKLEEAADHYKKAGTRKAAARVLECLFASGQREGYARELSELSRKDPNNIRAAAISAYAASQWGMDNIHPFCRDPFALVRVDNVRAAIEPFESFIKDLTVEIEIAKPMWQPPGKTTKNGFQTTGNLFLQQTPAVSKLRALVRNRVEDYRARNAGAPDAFIAQWPEHFDITAWHVKLLKSGYQEAHIHPSGWLSGVFYMRVPKAVSGEEGAIAFGLHGYDYPIIKQDLPRRVHHPQDGDLAMFPSSLFHRTIPFASDEDRLIVAFDVQPVTS